MSGGLHTYLKVTEACATDWVVAGSKNGAADDGVRTALPVDGAGLVPSENVQTLVAKQVGNGSPPPPLFSVITANVDNADG